MVKNPFPYNAFAEGLREDSIASQEADEAAVREFEARDFYNMILLFA